MRLDPEQSSGPRESPCAFKATCTSAQGSLALSARSSCPLACSTRARDPSVGKNWNQWAAKPGHYLTGTRCHWLAPAPVRAVAMTVWTGVAQRCQKEAPLFSPGIPIQLQGPLLGPQEISRASAAPTGSRTPLRTPTTSLPQPLPSIRCLAPPCPYTGTCRQPETHNHAGQRWPLRGQMSPSKSVPPEALPRLSKQTTEGCKPMLRAHGYSEITQPLGCGGFWETGKQS